VPPRFLGNPAVRMPYSQTPPGPARFSRLRTVQARSPTHLTGRTPGFISFEAQSHGLRTPCLRFASGVAPSSRKTRFRRSPTLSGGVGYPPGSTKGFCRALYTSSSFPRLGLAHEMSRVDPIPHASLIEALKPEARSPKPEAQE